MGGIIADRGAASISHLRNAGPVRRFWGVSFSLQVSSTDYVGNGSTIVGYPVAFPVVSSAHIAVAVRVPASAEPVALSPAQFQLVQTGESYTVQTAVAYSALDLVTVYRLLPYDQPFEFAAGGPLRTEEIERALDRIVMQVQQLWRDVTDGAGGSVLPGTGQSMQSLQVFADAAAQGAALPDYAGQAGMRLSDLTLWMASAVAVGQWEAVLPALPAGHTYARSAGAFTAALGGVDYHTIHLAADIPIQGTVIIPAGKTVVPGNYVMTRSGSSYLQVWGSVEAGRRQIFSGFGPGHVTGLFGSRWVYPEWWGLVEDNHDIAINCAVKASTLLTNGHALNISLAAGDYNVSADIDLGDTSVTIEGCGSNITRIVATLEWEDHQWLRCAAWGDMALHTPNHGSMFWLGASIGSAQSFRTKLKGFDIVANNAAFTHRATYRVSAISSRAGVEEGTIIHDIGTSGTSGFGIGFERHKNPATNVWAPTATLNGLDISSCWITGATLRTARPVYFSQFTNNCTMRNCTIDVGLAKSISSAYAAVGGGDPTIYAAPTWVCDYPEFAIVAQGNVTLCDIHIEGAIIGVLVPENSGASNVSMTNVKAFAMMDRARSAIYKLDGLSGDDPPSNTDFYGYGCAVLIAGASEAAAYPNQNWKGCCTANAVSILGGCCYLIRDDMYGVERTMFGMGQFPAGDLGGRFSFYTRGNAYARNTSSPYALIGGGLYDKANPTTSPSNTRTFFIGPIY